MDMNGSRVTNIFNNEGENQVRSPDRLDEYMRVASPGTWILAAALGIMIIALIVWGLVGSVSENLNMTGIGINLEHSLNGSKIGADGEEPYIDSVLCLVSVNDITLAEITDKDAVAVFRDGTRVHGTCSPLSYEVLGNDELHKLLEDYYSDTEWVFSKLSENTGAYSYAFTVVLDDHLEGLYWGDTSDVTVTLKELSPLNYLLEE